MAKSRVGAMGFLPMAKCRRIGAMRVLSDDMVREILKWLPTKSLMRFKAVSKSWLSAILDPSFARAHRAPFRGLLLMNPDPTSSNEGKRQPTRDFFVANLDEDNGGESNNSNEVNFTFQFSIPEDLRRFHVTNMVNGIICLYDRNVAKLCNVATREIINLPESKCTDEYCVYHIGFDPIQNVYKLLKICHFFVFTKKKKSLRKVIYRLRSVECEILTLGVDSSWRFINPPPNCPPNFIATHGLCVDGVLYWMGPVEGGLAQKDWYPLFSFNVAGEKFQSIHYPDGLYPSLVQFGTNLALSKLDMYNQPKITITYYREGSWSEISKYIVNPDSNDSSSNFFGLIVRGLLPNGNLMMYNDIGLLTDSPIYLFDPTRNYIQKFTVKFPASDLKLRGRICWYDENIISLKCLSGF